MFDRGARFRTALVAAGVIGVLVPIALVRQRQADTPIDGFTAASAVQQRQVEQRIAAFPSIRRLQADHRYLTAEPHVAGSPRDRELAEWTRDEWLAAGLDTVEIVRHDVLLPYPGETAVEMIAPGYRRVALHEQEGEDGNDATATLPAYHAYGASGDVTAPVVFAGSGTPADFDWLASHGVETRGKIVLLRYAVPYSYRGYKVFTAQQHGAAAVLMYSDPDDEGTSHGPGYPAGPWGPDDRIQRGGVGFDFLVPGDPLTPGWASTPGAKRLDRAAATTLPSIMSVPISARDAEAILQALEGPASPRSWHGKLQGGYRVGPGASMRVRVRNDEAIRPIWTVIGRLTGSTHPDQWVLAGNHRDAWAYGGVDPSSGSTVLMEMARALGSLARDGLRPRRTIVLASWDAEEFALTSSTEWGEQHERELREKAVAYLNVDAAVSGTVFSARAVPSLATLVASVARTSSSAVSTRIGGGSDYTVFLNFVGIPVVDMRFEGPYGVYHSEYDNHDWVSRFADPGFLRHAELTRIWSTLTARLANADLLPLDQTRYARRIGDFLRELEPRLASRTDDPGGTGLAPAFAALARFDRAATADATRAAEALARGDAALLDRLNRGRMHVEAALLDPAGLDHRPWFRHQIYAPAYTYEAEVLPGLAEAVDRGSATAVEERQQRLAAALDRAAAALTPLP